MILQLPYQFSASLQWTNRCVSLPLKIVTHLWFAVAVTKNVFCGLSVYPSLIIVIPQEHGMGMSSSKIANKCLTGRNSEQTKMQTVSSLVSRDIRHCCKVAILFSR